MSIKPEYWQKFPDGSPDRWRIELHGERWHVSMPNGAQIEVDTANPVLPYNADFVQDGDSSRLWANSIRYVVPILDGGDHRTAWTLLEQLNEFLNRDLKDAEGKFSGSLDHQFALQLRTLCELRAWILRNRDVDDFSDVNNQLRTAVASIYSHVQSIGLLRPNNHGIMLGISLLHSFFMFDEVPWTLTREPSENGQDLVANFLIDSLRSILGDDGVANENTPIYQGFYLKLLGGITDFQTWAYGEAQPEFAAMNAQATEAYRRMLLPNGAVPPLGDASISMQGQYKPLTGFWASLENGLLVRSTKDSFFSFTCGYRGVFHKQLDDSSIYLWHQGDALIQDAGLKSYDGNDPVSVAMRGQLGHSGLFFPAFDGVRAEKVVGYGTGTRLVDASMRVGDGASTNSFQAIGRYAFRNVRVERMVTWTGERSFILRDEVFTDQGAGIAVSRFLLDPRAKVEFLEDGVVAVRTENAWMTIASSRDGMNVCLSKGHADDESMPRGFLAPRNYSSTPTYLLEFQIPIAGDAGAESLSGKHLLRIAYGGVNDPLTVHH